MTLGEYGLGQLVHRPQLIFGTCPSSPFLRLAKSEHWVELLRSYSRQPEVEGHGGHQVPVEYFQ